MIKKKLKASTFLVSLCTLLLLLAFWECYSIAFGWCRLKYHKRSAQNARTKLTVNCSYPNFFLDLSCIPTRYSL